ncbi:hypothetical protein ASPSYDRAFT_40234 [Aspergillus sydowii CBS 593.65]|uniref:NmrA-like domain-containing protein n=1 Tax=Aspergillus sydowii CBS 593.65 TaxID=1036612 RepID=A0A1L9TQJ1_9EURO|nr:uncharacterized protein ASPSYDRAFT_40234 [Aspergillus sydowii CBS 593.65]OJJ61691.1 hypothetical protein ASPSYDRAFT_40234 [Aspergillus sydowii CBS 593.65]
MQSAKNIAIIAASGTLGSVVLKKLLDAGNFTVTVLTRAGSFSRFPDNAKVLDVDYSSHESLKRAFAGQDIVLSFVPTVAAESQIAIINAAAEAGVSRFIPSEYSANLDNEKARNLPIFRPKVKVQEHLVETAKFSGLTYTFIYGGAWLDAGSSRSFVLNFSGQTTCLYDGGDVPFSATTLGSVADAVLSTITHLDETRNRSVFVHSLVTTQNHLVSLAKEVAPELLWNTTSIKLDDLTAKSDKRLAQGLFDFETFSPYIFRAIFDPKFGGLYVKTDNQLLGIHEASDEDVKSIFRRIFEALKVSPDSTQDI